MCGDWGHLVGIEEGEDCAGVCLDRDLPWSPACHSSVWLSTFSPQQWQGCTELFVLLSYTAVFLKELDCLLQQQIDVYTLERVRQRERESEWQLSNCLSQNWVVLPPEWRQTTKIKFVSLYGRRGGSILNERVCCLQQTATRGTEKAE